MRFGRRLDCTAPLWSLIRCSGGRSFYSGVWLSPCSALDVSECVLAGAQDASVWGLIRECSGSRSLYPFVWLPLCSGSMCLRACEAVCAQWAMFVLLFVILNNFGALLYGLSTFVQFCAIYHVVISYVSTVLLSFE